eukprot:366404-Chlamydomonas_euryale.AAC.10
MGPPQWRALCDSAQHAACSPVCLTALNTATSFADPLPVFLTLDPDSAAFQVFDPLPTLRGSAPCNSDSGPPHCMHCQAHAAGQRVQYNVQSCDQDKLVASTHTIRACSISARTEPGRRHGHHGLLSLSALSFKATRADDVSRLCVNGVNEDCVQVRRHGSLQGHARPT